jgi:ABC-type amino acid transport substrate-binding protein
MTIDRRQFACAILLAGAGASVRAAAPASAAVQSLPSGLIKAPDGNWVAPDIARVMQRGELVVAMLGSDSPPFFHVKEGKLVGTDVRMAQQLAAELKVPLRIDRAPGSFDEVIGRVASGRADMGISKLSRTLGRAQSVRFTEPYLRLKHALMLNRVEFARLSHRRKIEDVLRDYRGTLGVIANSSFATNYAPRNFPAAQLVTFPTWELVVEGVITGKVVAAYRDELEIRRMLAADPGLALNLRIVAIKDLEDTLGIAVGYRDEALLALANQYLAQAAEKLTVEKVLSELR